jgi:hypothetical protein
VRVGHPRAAAQRRGPSRLPRIYLPGLGLGVSAVRRSAVRGGLTRGPQRAHRPRLRRPGGDLRPAQRGAPRAPARQGRSRVRRSEREHTEQPARSRAHCAIRRSRRHAVLTEYGTAELEEVERPRHRVFALDSKVQPLRTAPRWTDACACSCPRSSRACCAAAPRRWTQSSTGRAARRSSKRCADHGLQLFKPVAMAAESASAPRLRASATQVSLSSRRSRRLPPVRVCVPAVLRTLTARQSRPGTPQLGGHGLARGQGADALRRAVGEHDALRLYQVCALYARWLDLRQRARAHGQVSNFFINYVVLNGLGVFPFGLLRIGSATSKPSSPKRTAIGGPVSCRALALDRSIAHGAAASVRPGIRELRHGRARHPDDLCHRALLRDGRAAHSALRRRLLRHRLRRVEELGAKHRRRHIDAARARQCRSAQACCPRSAPIMSSTGKHARAGYCGAPHRVASSKNKRYTEFIESGHIPLERAVAADKRAQKPGAGALCMSIVLRSKATALRRLEPDRARPR